MMKTMMAVAACALAIENVQAGDLKHDALKFAPNLVAAMSDLQAQGQLPTGRTIMALCRKWAFDEGYKSEAQQKEFARIAMQEAMRIVKAHDPLAGFGDD